MCFLDAQASQETADAMRSPHGCVQYMRARYCRPGDDVTISLRDTHFLVEDGVEEVLLRPPTVTKLSNLPVHPAAMSLEGAWRYVAASSGPSVSDPIWGTYTHTRTYIYIYIYIYILDRHKQRPHLPPLF